MAATPDLSNTTPLGGGGGVTGGTDPFSLSTPSLSFTLSSPPSVDEMGGVKDETALIPFIDRAFRNKGVALDTDTLAGYALRLLEDSDLTSNLQAFEANPLTTTGQVDQASVASLLSNVNQILFTADSGMPDVAQQALGEVAKRNGRLTPSDISLLSTGFGGKSDIVQIITEEAVKAGVDPALAIAIAYQESGLDPRRVGDNGHSVGLFQLHDEGMGAGMGDTRYDPRTNAAKALASLAQTIAAHPDVTDPGVLAVLSQRPALHVNGQEIPWTDDPSVIATTDEAGAYRGHWEDIKAGKIPTPNYSPTAPQDALIAQLNKQSPKAESIYEKYTGQKPDLSTMQALVAHDNGPNGIEDYVRSLGSHIDGMNLGQYFDARSQIDQATMKTFGHPGTDDMVKDLFDRGMTDPGGIDLVLSELASLKPKDFDTGLYNQLFAANQPHYRNYLNETGANPKDLMQQYDQAKAAGVTVTPSDQSSQANSAAVDTSGTAPATSDQSGPPSGGGQELSPQ